MDSTHKNYRQGVYAYILDKNDNFLITQLVPYKDNEWSTVGGGREGDETPEENLIREVKEEIGLDRSQYDIIGKSKEPYRYDFPESIIKEGITYHGQEKEQFVLRLKVDHSELQFEKREIRDHKWVKFEDVQSHFIFPNQYENFFRTIQEVIPEIII